MSYTTGAICNASESGSIADRVLVCCVNNSLTLSASVEIQVFQFVGIDLAKIASGQTLVLGPPHRVNHNETPG